MKKCPVGRPILTSLQGGGECTHDRQPVRQGTCPAHVYLLWIDSAGKAFPLYPWNRGTSLDITDLTVLPPCVPPQREVSSPAQWNRGWEMEGPSGLETILLLARRTPLPEDVQLVDRIGQLAPAPFVNPGEVQKRGLVQGRWLSAPEGDPCRRPATKQKVIDNSLLELMERLRGDFEILRAVRFAHLGD